MYPFISGSGTAERSIEQDDRNGMQAAYGAINVNTKPRIDDITISGNQITITGDNFAASANQIWFTQAGAGGTGAPVKVTGLNSNGTTLTATIPANAGPGDVLVRNNASGNDDLSGSRSERPERSALPGPDVVLRDVPELARPGHDAGLVGNAERVGGEPDAVRYGRHPEPGRHLLLRSGADAAALR